MKTYWANFVKTGNPNIGSFNILAGVMGPPGRPPFWPPFDTLLGNQIQALTPQGLLTPQGPHPFDTFRTEHFCDTWQPLLTFDNGNEPQQP
jgi:hypothetical protein